jgi:sugar lactone lactonase YvrE
VNTTEVVVDGLAFPECPRWRPDGLWFSDQHAGQILRIGLAGTAPAETALAETAPAETAPSEAALTGTAEVMADIPGGPSGLGWLPDGTLLAVSMHEKKLFQVAFGNSASAATDAHPAITLVAELGPYHEGLSNDMVVDGAGRCYIGNIGFDVYGGEALRPTVLLLVEPLADRSAEQAGSALSVVEPRVVAEDLVVPNGSAITPAGDRLIVAETMAHRLTSFRIATDGSLDDRQVFADLGHESPDGICLDADGGIWFASIAERQVVRVEEGGKVTERVSTGGRRAIACILGGNDRRDLYVCTAGTLDPNRTLEERSGAIELCRVDIPGAGFP